MSDPILTADDLVGRWKLGDDDSAVWRAVDDESNALPFVYLGRGAPQPNRAGQRGLYRFRLVDVEQWEARQVRSFAKDRRADDERAATSLVGVAGFDGKLRTGRKGKAGPRRSVTG